MEMNDDWDEDDSSPDRIPPIEDRLWAHPSEYVGSKVTWNRKLVFGLGGLALIAVGLLAAKTIWPTSQVKILAKPASTISIGVDTANYVSKLAQSLVTIHLGTKSAQDIYGLAISPNGYILVPANALPRQSSYQVTISGIGNQTASLVSEDTSTDTAVIKVDRKLTNYISGTSQRSAQSGEMTIGIGIGTKVNKPKLVISQIKATNLYQPLPNGLNSPGSMLADASQKLNPEGLLFVDSHGNPLGIGLSQIYSEWIISPLTQMLSSAQKIELADGAPKGWLGIVGMSSDKSAKSSKGPTSTTIPEGVMILSVAKNSPAQLAGIKANDEIIDINNVKISSLSELQTMLSKLPSGSEINLTIIRNGKTEQVKTQLGVKSGP